jgi:hypothetical protein
VCLSKNQPPPVTAWRAKPDSRLKSPPLPKSAKANAENIEHPTPNIEHRKKENHPAKALKKAPRAANFDFQRSMSDVRSSKSLTPPQPFVFTAHQSPDLCKSSSPEDHELPDAWARRTAGS